jgi:CheY-like chemotaxis protein
MATSESTSVILLDMSLPIMDGWEAARHLKANTDTKGISILRLSAHAMTSDRDKDISVGCDDCDTKPLDINHLLVKIQALLGTSDAG